MKRFTALFRRPAQVALRHARLTVERLESRDLPSASALIPSPSSDPILTIAQAEFTQDNSTLNRTDIIDLFDTVAGTQQAIFSSTGTVSFEKVPNPDLTTPLPASSVTDLRDIFVHESSQWGLSPGGPVANLAAKVAGFNLANEQYKNATLLPNGRLEAGDPAQDLKDLVDKWFYGTDLPAIDVAGATYQQASGSLFGSHGPKARDVAQGAAQDCYFLSSLAETALQSPQTIQSMFTDNGDGTYSVRFYNYDSITGKSTVDFVTVNLKLPANSAGHFVYANNDFRGNSTNIANQNNVLWVALAEKAYAQLAEEGWSRGNDDANAYKSINLGGGETASQQITGSADASFATVNDGNNAQAQSTIDTLAADFQNGYLITVLTLDQTMTVPGLLDNHVYYVTAINTQNQTITLTNPFWWTGAKRLTLSIQDLVNNTGTTKDQNIAVVGTTADLAGT